jgi:hypothetical protein
MVAELMQRKIEFVVSTATFSIFCFMARLLPK